MSVVGGKCGREEGGRGGEEGREGGRGEEEGRERVSEQHLRKEELLNL